MSSIVTSRGHGAAIHERRGIERLRYPGERSAFVACALSNALVVGLAVAIVLSGPHWLDAHPDLARHVDVIRTIVLAALIAVPATGLTRRAAFAAARSGGVRVDAHQFAELHARYLDACRTLGFARAPELYMSRGVEGCVEAHTLLRGRSVIVLDAELVDSDWREGLDWLTFLAARALGAIRLGHTRWWVELLIVYARHVPGLRTPVLVRAAYSCDRCAAFAVPDGIRGLLVEAVGNHALTSVDVAAFLEQTRAPLGAWDRAANVLRRRPSLAARARALYDDGFFDLARDRHAPRDREAAHPQ